MTQRFTIAVLGGTGQEGSGLALRWANAGHRVIIGSRDGAKASVAAMKMKERLPNANISGSSNSEAAAAAEIVVLTVPFSAQRLILDSVREHLNGKLLVDATVPLIPPHVARVQLPSGGSAVAEIQAMFGDGVRVVSAFQNISAHYLDDLAHKVDCDVLICGNDPAAREIVIGLAADIGLRGLHAGPINNSAAAEALTSILISINKRYKVPGSGIRITGLQTENAG